MTDAEMIESSRSIVLAIQRVAAKRELDGSSRVALGSLALVEFLAQWLGPVGAVERLRDMADVCERQYLAPK